ncbi:MAG: hypothetical protein K2M44_07070, partial [Clostridia bacterium]|nr:hypothetical protein [Clostridia bacterium]
MLSKRYRLISALSAAVIIVGVLLCFTFISFNNINEVFAFYNITPTITYDIGNILLEDYESRKDDNVFDGDAMKALYALLTGDSSKSDISDVDALGTLSSADLRSHNENKDIILTLDGKQWTATHLTKDRDGNTILTLWLARSDDACQWNTWSVYDASYKYLANIYSTSYIRAVALNSGGSGYVATDGATELTKIAQSDTHTYARLTMPSIAGSLTDFIVTPSHVAYQETENQSDLADGYTHTLLNDAYGTPSGNINYFSAEIYDDVTTTDLYSEWKDDYIWLPSITETGVKGYALYSDGIWDLSSYQRYNSINSFTRSTYSTASARAYALLYNTDSLTGPNVDTTGAARPALHLNLDLVAKHSTYAASIEPTDVTVEYKGTPLTLDDIAVEQKTWYDTSKISVEYPSGGIKDAGIYKIKAEIKPEIIAGGGIFKGTPDLDAGESDTVRYFNFTVTKKKIGIKAELDSGGLPIVTLNNAGDVYTGDTPENGRAPSFGFTYKSSSGVEYETLPTDVGTYTATAKMTNECNYEIDTDNSTLSVIYKVDKKSVDKPALSGQVTKQYNGEAQSFTLQGVTADVTLTLPDGVTYTDGALSATNAGTYKITVALKNTSTMIWSDGTDSAYELTVTITKRPLNITINAPLSWKVGETPTVTIVGDSLAADTTELHIYYCKNGSSVKYDLDAYKVITGKTRTIIMPVLDQGDYYIGVELFGDKQGNSNYDIPASTVTQTFKVLGNDITFTDADIKWQYNGTPVTNPSATLTLTYTGSIFRFSIDASDLAIKGVKIDTTKGTNGYSGDITATNAKTSGAYSVTVYITEYDNTYAEFDAVYTLTYSIDKAKYDLSGLAWDYNDSNPLQFIAGKAQGITLTGTLPTGLTVSYAGNGNIPVGSYTTTASFNVSDALNYYKPISSDSNTYLGNFEWSKAWRIDKATITCSWKIDTRENVATYNLPILQSIGSMDVDSMVTYRYYDYQSGS